MRNRIQMFAFLHNDKVNFIDFPGYIEIQQIIYNFYGLDSKYCNILKANLIRFVAYLKD